MSETSIPIDISQDSNYTSVFTSEIDKAVLSCLCDFYQYKAANESDSPLSIKIDVLLSNDEKDELYGKLLDVAGLNECDFLFNSLLRNKIKDIRVMKLSDNTLVCDRIKGFFHQKAPSKSGKTQHKIDSLLKHIRDSFAHGRIAFANEHLILEDKRNELTARLVITLDVLIKWKNIIEQYCTEKKGENTNGNF